MEACAAAKFHKTVAGRLEHVPVTTNDGDAQIRLGREMVMHGCVFDPERPGDVLVAESVITTGREQLFG